jgi:uncharacterized protein (TIGR03435 family)
MVKSPVADTTGLTGTYDVVLATSPDRGDQPGRTIFDAVDALGLKLVPHKISVEALVIDKVTKSPSPN